mgnify:FL=1
MDNSVLESIKRWPNVPAVFGWLSLTARGQWRLHPDGKATEGSAGESISNPQILAFINRNYASDERGRWYFQNGPQRVYVRLDAAPWILFADDAQGQFNTHTGSVVANVDCVWLDEQGHIYLHTELGPGMIVDRDLPRFLAGAKIEVAQLAETAQTALTLEDWWAQGDATTSLLTGLDQHWPACANPLPVHRLAVATPIDTQLKFVANPQPA